MVTIVNFMEKSNLILTSRQNHLVLNTDNNKKKKGIILWKKIVITPEMLDSLSIVLDSFKGVSLKKNLQIIQQHNINYKMKQK